MNWTVLNAQITVQLRFRDPLVTDARQGFKQAALDQVQHGLVTGVQLAGDFVGGVYFQNITHSLGVAAPHPSGHGAAHALLQRGEFRETGLAEMHSPTIGEMAGLERRPSLAVNFVVVES